MFESRKSLSLWMLLAIFLLCFIFAYFWNAQSATISYQKEQETEIKSKSEEKPKFIVTHILPPEPVKAIYMSSWVAGTKNLRDKLVKLIDETEINAVVIDIKDDTGKVSFEVEDPFLVSIGSSEKRIADLREFIGELHEKGIYVIGRLASFQDPYMTSYRPDIAVKRASTGAVWKDRKGLSWIDAGSQEMWDYLVAIAKESYRAGFDEINFDYIRFPSDGDMKDIGFPISEGREKAEVILSFFEYVNQKLKPEGITISADLFGMTTTNTNDLNIGQILEHALSNFDFVAPMVYPSHYPPTFYGYDNPNKYPYEIVNVSMVKAVERANLLGVNPLKLRPWLQDFDYGGNYDIAEVRAQIKATYDAGLTSWMLWSPSNQYTRGALE